MSAAAAQLILVPAPEAQAAPPVARHTLVEFLSDIEAIQTTLDSLDDTDLESAARTDLERMLTTAMTGTREKIDRTAGILASFEAAAGLAKTEAARYAKRAAYFEKHTERLEKHMLAVMAASGQAELKGATVTLTARKNPPSVVIDDEMQIPVDFLRWPEEPPPPPPVPDKKLIAAALKADATSVPGAHLAQGMKLVRA